MGKFVDLSGNKYGKLQVLNREPNINKRTMWRCLCECGNEKVIRGSSLITGLTRSCGSDLCKIKNQNKDNENGFSLNTFDLTGEYGIGFTRKGEMFMFDLEDYDLIKNYTWHISSGYVKTLIRDDKSKKQKTITMHRLVMGVTDPSIFVDHIFHNKTDNRKSQLRLVTPLQNSQNNKPKEGNVCNGVYWYDRTHKWEALIGINGKIKYLGLFDNYQDAVNARLKAESEYYGEYKYTRSKDTIENNNNNYLDKEFI